MKIISLSSCDRCFTDLCGNKILSEIVVNEAFLKEVTFNPFLKGCIVVGQMKEKKNFPG